MINKYSIYAIVLITSISAITIPTNAIYTGEINTSSEINISRKISLKVWGFDAEYNSIKDAFGSKITMITENSNDSLSKTDIHEVNLAGRNYHYKNTFNFNYDHNPINTQLYQDLFKVANDTGIYGENIGNFTNIYYNGLSIPLRDFSQYLSTFNEKNMVTIHLIDFESLNGENNTHWFRHGVTNSITTINEDMRNIGIVGENGIFFDPTAIAPRFDNETYTVNTEDKVKLIKSRIVEIIEKIILLSPLPIQSQISLQEQIDVAQIIFIRNSTDKLGVATQRSSDFSHVQSSLLELLPYIEMRFSRVVVNLDKYKKIDDYINSFSELINGSSTVMVNKTFAEGMKYLIRNEKDFYLEYPGYYYYPLFIMGDDADRDFKTVKNGELQNYEVGEIGFALMNIKYYDIEEHSNLMVKEELRIFGKLLGISDADTQFLSQLETTASRYGVIPGWRINYNSFQRDSIAIRIGVGYNTTTLSNIRQLRNYMKDKYSWFNRTALDVTESKLREGDFDFRKGAYVNATSKYIEAFNLWKEADKSIASKIRGYRNSWLYLTIMIMFAYIIYSLFDLTIPIEEYKKKYRKHFKKEKVTQEE